MYFHNTVKEIPVLINAEAVEPFLHEEFAAWWQPANGGHAIVAVLYNNEARTGYEEVEVIVASLTAGHKIGLTPGGGVVPL